MQNIDQVSLKVRLYTIQPTTLSGELYIFLNYSSQTTTLKNIRFMDMVKLPV